MINIRQLYAKVAIKAIFKKKKNSKQIIHTQKEVKKRQKSNLGIFNKTHGMRAYNALK